MSATSETDPLDLESVAKQIVDEGRGLLQWQWDDRFSAALSTVETPDDDHVLGLVQRSLQRCWNYVDVERAPEPIRAVADAWGGLMPGQRLFASDPTDGPVLFAAWWPWENGTTYSLRVGCAETGRRLEEASPRDELRRWFSL